MPIIDPELIARARAAAEKRAVLGATAAGGIAGAALAPKGHALRGAGRGAGVGLATGLGAGLGGLGGATLGGLGGAGLGFLAGGGLGSPGQSGLQFGGGSDVPPQALAAIAGGLLGAGVGGTAGGIGGGIGGFRLGKQKLWDQPWPDRELPHGVSGADDDDEDGPDGRGKQASFARRLGELAAIKTRKRNPC